MKLLNLNTNNNGGAVKLLKLNTNTIGGAVKLLNLILRHAKKNKIYWALLHYRHVKKWGMFSI